MNKQNSLSAYRWVILGAFAMISIVVQLQWLTHAPIARPAAVFYKGQFNPDSFLDIDFLALLYMLVYLIISIPASHIINKYGIRLGIGLGAILAAIGAGIKGAMGASYIAVVVGQVFLSVAQPFILNALTAVTVRWFPVKERALAAGLASLAQYLGIFAAMLFTPMMVNHDPSSPGYGQGTDTMLRVYGIITVASCILTLILMRERPAIAPSDESIERYGFSKGFKHMFSLRDMNLMVILFTIGLGIFNAVSSMVDAIAANLGVKDSDGMIGGLMLIGGIIGAVIIPILSDLFYRRKLFLIICLAGMVPGIAGLTFAAKLTGGLGVNPEAAYNLALASSFILGFFVMSAGPIGFQYAAEISAPTPESTSQGVLILSGQISGIIMVAGMSIKSNIYLPYWMIIFVLGTVIAFIITLLIRESPIILAERAKHKKKLENP
jgi:MFS family permease